MCCLFSIILASVMLLSPFALLPTYTYKLRYAEGTFYRKYPVYKWFSSANSANTRIIVQ